MDLKMPFQIQELTSSDFQMALFAGIFIIGRNYCTNMIFICICTTYGNISDFHDYHYQKVLILVDSYRQCLLSIKAEAEIC